MHLGNAVILMSIMLALAGAFIWYYRYIQKFDGGEEPEEDERSIPKLVRLVNETFASMQKRNLREMNLSRREYEKRRRRKAELKNALREAAYGNQEAKRLVKAYIRDIIQGKRGVGEKNIDEYIPFLDEKKLTGQDKFEILIYLYAKEYGKAGFAKFMVENGLDKPAVIHGEERYEVTKERLDRVYREVLGKKELSYQDKLEILTQRVFEAYKGFGVADLLFESDIDEIDAGVSGIPKGGFDIGQTREGWKYSFDSIWILFRGMNIYLSCIGFGSQKELVRVCSNVYRYEPPKMLSRRDGAVVATMKNGSRVVVVRPPIADSYAMFVRKFDSAGSVKAEELIQDENAVIAICMLKWLIRGQRNIAITGSQGTGKTTLLKSLVSYIDPAFNIRLQELTAELNLRFAYPDRNIVSLQETASFSAQEGLNLQKKTNGAVNIVGEVATAAQASYIVQTAKVASLFALFTHHGKTAKDTVEAIGNNLLELGLYNDKKDAFKMAAQVINIDCHLVNVKGNRHIERITEIIPTTDTQYPSETTEKMGKDTLALDTMEYYRRQTDRALFTVRDLVIWEDGAFHLLQMPSEGMLADIKSKLSASEEAQFQKDMLMCRQLDEKVGGRI